VFTFKICSSEELSKIAETPLWVTDIALGACSWLVALPIMAFGLLQGIAGTLAMAYMSKSILPPLRDDPVNRGFWGLPGAHIIYDWQRVHHLLCRRFVAAGDSAARASASRRKRMPSSSSHSVASS